MNKNRVASKGRKLINNDYLVCFNAYSPVRSMTVKSPDMLCAMTYLESIFTAEFLSNCLVSIELQLPF